MIRQEDLIADFEEALAMACPYATPGTTAWSRISEGVDCSGLFAAAFARHGGSIPHGSNTIARRSVTGLEKIASAAQLNAGDAVFKWSESGEPERFRKDGLGNFHHIGLVAQVNPLRIIHASSAAGRVTCDSSAAKWQYAARLKNVTAQNTEGEETMSTMPENARWLLKVRPARLNIRGEATTDAAVTGTLNKNREVWASEESGGWYRLCSGEGWVCARYVTVKQTVEPQDTESGEEDENDGTAEVTLTDLCESVTALSGRVNELEEGLAALSSRLDALKEEEL